MAKVQVDYSGYIKVKDDENPRELYSHQNEAVKALNEINKQPFEGLLVLPTGGGKTLTAVHWLLRDFINKNKKVLWVAHRHELLDQAFETIKFSAYSSSLTSVSGFRYRIISGHPKHDRPVNIEKTDDIIIASKDSLNSGLEHLLKNWVGHLDEVLLIVDEAHHSTAKTYRKLINGIKDDLNKRGHEKGFKMLGLTATPFRTDESEKGLLKLVFPDDIIFSEHLRTLITRGILAEPIFENLETKLGINKKLTARDIQNIENFDRLPKNIREQIAQSSIRNSQILNHYIKNREKYKPLLIFAIDVSHAITLNSLFQAKGINSDYIVSSVKDANTGITISSKENSEKIKKFRNGEIEVLINVEMLTEGTDLPNVQTVFLTRPTASKILMTQMIGRALRGQKAGGTEKAYVVSFIDQWEDKINWVNPEKLHFEEDAEFIEKDIPSNNRTARLISIEMIEEFARIMDDSIDTTDLEKIIFIKRIPLGIYRFSILEASEEYETKPINYDVLLYNDTEEAYDNFIHDLKILFQGIHLQDREILTEAELEDLLETAKNRYFPDHETLLVYRDEDVKNILRFYAQNDKPPEFLPFSERRKCDLSVVAKHIYDNSLGGKAKTDYINLLWNDEKSFWQVLFSYNKMYFLKQLAIELLKLEEPDIYGDVAVLSISNVISDTISIEKLSLYEIKARDIVEYRKIKNAVFAKHTNTKGFITCAVSGVKSQMRRDFQIDHIKPMSQGGLSTIDNLQVLTIKAHIEKTRRENTKR
ncbi:DEAD/DEAH box helicase family protein [Nodularia sphaerocarpa]|uniref:DEAD/DEAH box helicase family protein n=1 Tax=Nodularia sphaerocarpa TaxID=137816 RepID=UPI001EFBAB9D|nr:DEAD/DEAH box helicase family protein [Nodularia sphaerocarpa]MDB9373055.1 DEAD/DEAH box helicase family protein [Nodularia sphaerocarpa CS-585]MDB9380314.1 DEAD/DEAH box helicase family protein [Nodularia sphaerocarpa CS-585A2]ULP74481.1 Putative DNA repair helicase RadD [Nodularia sphaerocarpa UHCC 0038]